MKKNILRIIKEEVDNFNFLNGDDYQAHNEYLSLLKNTDFQKFFIESVFRKSTDIEKNDEYLTDVTGNWNDSANETGTINFEYETDVTYKQSQNTEPVEFQILINAKDVSTYVNVDHDGGDRMTAPYTEGWFSSVEWGDMDVMLFSSDGDEIEFNEYDKLTDMDQEKFIRFFIEDFFMKNTSMGIA